MRAVVVSPHAWVCNSSGQGIARPNAPVCQGEIELPWDRRLQFFRAGPRSTLSVSGILW